MTTLIRRLVDSFCIGPREVSTVPGTLAVISPKAIAVVGMACRFPGSRDALAYWDTIRTGRVCFTAITEDRWPHRLFRSPAEGRDSASSYAGKMGVIEGIYDFAPEAFGLPPRRVAVMDPQQRLVLDLTRAALEDAGYAVRRLPNERTGVFVGSSVVEHRQLATMRLQARQLFNGAFGNVAPPDAEYQERAVEGLPRIDEYTMVGNLGSMLASGVAQAFDLRGPAFTADAACASSLVALHQAVLNLRAGCCDVAIVGGAYLSLVPDNLVVFSRIGALSRSDRCRPFDADADGFVLGEGGGVLVLKSLEAAQRDGDRIQAIIRGVGVASDGRGQGPMTPRVEGQRGALEAAWSDAEISPSTLGYVEAHGTATAVGDATEITALNEELEKSKSDARCALGSVKANIGHTMSAAGMAGLIKAILVLTHKTFPPQPSITTLRAELDSPASRLFVPRVEQAWTTTGAPRRAGVSSFGFGGTNAHAVLEEAT